jgi:hypothetical protein
MSLLDAYETVIGQEGGDVDPLAGIPGITFWAEDGDVIATLDAPVSSVPNRTGGTALTGSGSTRPLKKAAWIEFDGTDDTLTQDFTAVGGSRYIFASIRSLSFSGTQRIIKLFDTATNDGINVALFTQIPRISGYSVINDGGGGFQEAQLNDAAYGTNQDIVFELARLDAGTITIRNLTTDASDTIAASGVAATFDRLVISDPGLPGNIGLKKIVVVQGVTLTAPQLTQIRDYMLL